MSGRKSLAEQSDAYHPLAAPNLPFYVISPFYIFSSDAV